MVIIKVMCDEQETPKDSYDFSAILSEFISGKLEEEASKLELEPQEVVPVSSKPKRIKAPKCLECKQCIRPKTAKRESEYTSFVKKLVPTLKRKGVPHAERFALCGKLWKQRKSA